MSYLNEFTIVQYNDNGLGDAYKHALWNALGAAKLSQGLIKELMDANEDKPFEYPLQYKEKIWIYSIIKWAGILAPKVLSCL